MRPDLGQLVRCGWAQIRPVERLPGALGAALGTMVANLSTSKAGFEDQKERLNQIASKGQAVKDALIKAIDDDTSAFDQVIKAMRMPKDTDADKKSRETAMQMQIGRASCRERV